MPTPEDLTNPPADNDEYRNGPVTIAFDLSIKLAGRRSDLAPAQKYADENDLFSRLDSNGKGLATLTVFAVYDVDDEDEDDLAVHYPGEAGDALYKLRQWLIANTAYNGRPS